MDAGEVQEKVKEVICKTITNIPLSEATSKEQLSDAVSTCLYLNCTGYPPPPHPVVWCSGHLSQSNHKNDFVYD